LPPSVIYRSAPLYELVMAVLYGRHYAARYKTIAELIPDGASVVDLCCGPGVLYTRYLRRRPVSYIGVDSNPGFVRRVIQSGALGIVADLSSAEIPEGDYVVMQASLYHFLPNAKPIVERMIAAARERVIVAEPIRNITGSRFRLLSAIGRSLTDAGRGGEGLRFKESDLDLLFRDFPVEKSFLIPGGREKVFVIRKSSRV